MENNFSNIEPSIPDDGPKITFLETFYGILFNPRNTFDRLYKEDSFTIFVYGVLAIFLSNLGKLEPGYYSFFRILGIEFIGFLSWFFVGLFIVFFSTVFKTPNNNFARLLGFTGLSHLPFFLLTPIALISDINPSIYTFAQIVIGFWAFILFWTSLSKSFQLETWRVVLLAIIPFLLGIFLFAFLIANVIGLVFSGFVI